MVKSEAGMRIVRLEIHNYKSLRDIMIEPGPLSVFVGPNGAGKTNLVDALDFLGDMYRWGLEAAVGKKGGYENICYRRGRRSRSPIKFKVEMASNLVVSGDDKKRRATIDVGVDHLFEIKAKSGTVAAPYYLASEQISVSEGEGWTVRASREPGQPALLEVDPNAMSDRVNRDALEFIQGDRGTREAFSELPLWEIMTVIYPGFSRIHKDISSLRVYQLSPRSSREASSPTSSPELDRFGRNLPSVVEFFKGANRSIYNTLLASVRKVMPSIDELETEFTHTKSLGLFVREHGMSRPWPAEDVSDGTIQAIALLAAILDPRAKIVAIEEAENNTHPWAVRNFVEAARAAAQTKQIFLTTHSPILIDQLKPEELWVVRRPEAETKIDPVMRLAPALEGNWGRGQYSLSEYLDSGILPAAVPAISS
jgi:predicted ATPase